MRWILLVNSPRSTLNWGIGGSAGPCQCVLVQEAERWECAWMVEWRYEVLKSFTSPFTIHHISVKTQCVTSRTFLFCCTTSAWCEVTFSVQLPSVFYKGTAWVNSTFTLRQLFKSSSLCVGCFYGSSNIRKGTSAMESIFPRFLFCSLNKHEGNKNNR